MFSTVYLSLGSNSGDRRAHIGRAVAALALRLPAVSMRTSGFYCSAPWGFESGNDFLNIAAAMTFDRDAAWSDAEAEALLDTLQGIERDISAMPHRNADGSYRDREIDIDIIAIDKQQISTQRLTIPHPLAQQRPFVTVPLGEITQGTGG